MEACSCLRWRVGEAPGRLGASGVLSSLSLLCVSGHPGSSSPVLRNVVHVGNVRLQSQPWNRFIYFYFKAYIMLTHARHCSKCYANLNSVNGGNNPVVSFTRAREVQHLAQLHTDMSRETEAKTALFCDGVKVDSVSRLENSNMENPGLLCRTLMMSHPVVSWQVCPSHRCLPCPKPFLGSGGVALLPNTADSYHENSHPLAWVLLGALGRKSICWHYFILRGEWLTPQKYLQLERRPC